MASKEIKDIVLSKIKPQAKESEIEVLGILMMEGHRIHDARLILSVDDFYSEAFQIIYAAMCTIDEHGDKIDTISVMQELSRNNTLEKVGGAYGLSKLTLGIVSGANFKRDCHIVKQYSIARKLIDFSNGVLIKSYNNDDPLQILMDADQELFQIVKVLEEAKVTTLEQIALQLADKVLSKTEQSKDKYLYTYIKEWDRINGPLFESGVYVVAGRPGMGKTAHAIQMLVNMALRYPVGLINVEMTNEQLVKRIISNMQELDNYTYKKEIEDWDEWEKAKFNKGLEDFLKLKLHIDSSSNDIDKIIQKIKFWVKRHGVRCVVIDYLQILSVAEEKSRYMTETQAINYILERIRSTAKELNIPIILLCQLNRELYRRAGNKEPNLGDLKGSGKIEEIAFQISFLHRPEYYDPEGLTDENGESIKGLCYQIIAKHRDGILDRIKHRVVLKFSRFEDWESQLVNWKPPQEEIKDLPF